MMFGQPLVSTQQRACGRKIRYSTWTTAEEAAKLLIEHTQIGHLRRYKGGYHMAYKCDYCDGWHVGITSPYVLCRALTKAGWGGAFISWRRSPTRVFNEA